MIKPSVHYLSPYLAFKTSEMLPMVRRCFLKNKGRLGFFGIKQIKLADYALFSESP